MFYHNLSIDAAGEMLFSILSNVRGSFVKRDELSVFRHP
jgi:hypothetical protein